VGVLEGSEGSRPIAAAQLLSAQDGCRICQAPRRTGREAAEPVDGLAHGLRIAAPGFDLRPQTENGPSIPNGILRRRERREGAVHMTLALQRLGEHHMRGPKRSLLLQDLLSQAQRLLVSASGEGPFRGSGGRGGVRRHAGAELAIHVDHEGLWQVPAGRHDLEVGGAHDPFPGGRAVEHLGSSLSGQKSTERLSNGAGLPARSRILADVPDYHATAPQAADAARKAEAGALALTHIVPPLPLKGLENVFLADAGERFTGPLWLAQDGDLYSLPAGGTEIERKNIISR